MKQLTVIAKTKYGLVKFPPKMAADAKKKLSFVLLQYVFLFSKSADIRKIAQQLAKDRGITLETTKDEHVLNYDFWKVREFRIPYNLEGLPDSYLKSIHNNPVKDLFLKYHKEAGEGMHLFMDFFHNSANQRGLDWKDSGGNFTGYYTETGLPSNSGMFIPSGSIVVFTDGFVKQLSQIESTLALRAQSEKDVVKHYDKFGTKNSGDYKSESKQKLNYYVKTAKVRLENALESLEELIEHELRHMVQVKLLPKEQNKQFKGYDLNQKGTRKNLGEGEGDYYISPGEFGPSINTALMGFKRNYETWMKEAKLWDIRYANDANTEKKFSRISESTIKQDLDAFTGKKAYNRSGSEARNFIYWQDAPSPELMLLKKRKLTAYNKAIKWAEKLVLPSLIESFKKLQKQKTVK